MLLIGSGCITKVTWGTGKDIKKASNVRVEANSVAS